MDAALFTFKDATGMGLDCMGPLLLKHLPLEAREELAMLLTSVVEQQAWPWQALMACVALIPKVGGGGGGEAGGERPIGLLTFLVRLFTRCCRPKMRKWCDAYCGHWDHAVSSSSALRSALVQHLRVEIAQLTSRHWALILWDLREFYDSIGLAALVDSALRRHYPARVLHLIVQAYQAPRVLRCGKSSSEWVTPVDSIVAGCGEANNLARCALYEAAEAVSRVSPLMQLGQFVDDIKV